MDGGAWQATVHGVTKSQTRLSVHTHAHMEKKTVGNLQRVLALCQAWNRGLDGKTLTACWLSQVVSNAWDREKGIEGGQGQLEGEQVRDDSSAEFMAHTVRLQLPRLTAAAACLVDGLDNENVLGPTLQPMDRVVVLLDVGHDHPAIG